VAAGFQFLTSREPAMLGLAMIYPCLIAVIALTAVFTSRPARRKAALEVLALLLPGRRRTHTIVQQPRQPRRRRDPPDLPPPNP
jgi:hypothetical protein